MRVVSEKKIRPPIVPDTFRTDLDESKREQIERESEEPKYVPLWAKDIVENREKEQSKKI